MTSEWTYHDCVDKDPRFYVGMCPVWIQTVGTNICSNINEEDLLHVVCVGLFLVVRYTAPQDEHTYTYHMD